MRKLISTEKRRVLENLAVNNDGTIVEVGGNVALQSIEKIGMMGDPDFKYEIPFDKIPYLFDTTVIASGVPEGGVSTNMDVQNMAGPFQPLSDGQLAIETAMISPGIYDIRVGWKPLNGTQKFCIFNAGDKNKYFRFNSSQIIKPEYVSEVGKQFKPFIKYQDGKIYILNENGGYTVVS